MILILEITNINSSSMSEILMLKLLLLSLLTAKINYLSILKLLLMANNFTLDSILEIDLETLYLLILLIKKQLGLEWSLQLQLIGMVELTFILLILLSKVVILSRLTSSLFVPDKTLLLLNWMVSPLDVKIVITWWELVIQFSPKLWSNHGMNKIKNSIQATFLNSFNNTLLIQDIESFLEINSTIGS
jgi:hypothetical protein